MSINKSQEGGVIAIDENLRAILPGYGLLSKFIDLSIGHHVNRDVKKWTPISWNLIR